MTDVMLPDEVDLGAGNSLQSGGIVAPRVTLSLGIIREASPRRRCAICKVRRVLYRIGVATLGGSDMTAARCGPCWGITP